MTTVGRRRCDYLLCLEEIIGLPSRSLQEELSDLFVDDQILTFINDYAKSAVETKEAKEIGITYDEAKSLLAYGQAINKLETWIRNNDNKDTTYTTILTRVYEGLVKLSRSPKNHPQTTWLPNVYGEIETDETGFRGKLLRGAFRTSMEPISCRRSAEKTYLEFFEIVGREEEEGGIHKGVMMPSWLNFCPDAEVMYPPLTIFQVKSTYRDPKTGLSVLVVDPMYLPMTNLPLLEPNNTIWKAVWEGNADSVVKWLKSHPSVNLEAIHPGYQCSLLYSAARNGKLDIVEALVEGCAHVDSQASSMHSTPLHAAAYYGFPKVVEYLLSQGANPSIQNALGCRPIDETSSKQELILGLLVSAPKVQQPIVEGKLAGSYLVYGDRLTYLKGLKHILSTPVLTLEEEFSRDISFIEKHTGKNTVKELWKKAQGRLNFLKCKPEALNAKLTPDEILAVHLYTGPVYKLINDFLRELNQAKPEQVNEHLSKEKTWVSTVLHINTAIRKLVTLATSYPITYRGVAAALQPDFFVPDKRGIIAATEFGFMSTSESEANAMFFASNGSNATVFCIKCRPEDPAGFHMGASLEWCTLSKGEKEILFPPLTMFEVIAREKKKNVTTVTVTPSFI